MKLEWNSTQHRSWYEVLLSSTEIIKYTTITTRVVTYWVLKPPCAQGSYILEVIGEVLRDVC